VIRPTLINLYRSALATGMLALAAGSFATNPQAIDLAKTPKLINETNDSSTQAAPSSFPKRPADFYLRNQQAKRALVSGHCQQALPLLERSVKEYAEDGNLWRALALCKAQLQQPDAAIDAFRKAIALGATPWDLNYGDSEHANDMMIRIAMLYAGMGQKQKALEWLERGLRARFDERNTLADKTEFNSLRSNAKFAHLLGLPDKKVTSRDEKWRRDIAFFREQVAMLHVYPSHHTDAKKLDHMLSQLSARVPQLSDEQITAKLVRFVGALGAGHDMFWPVEGKRVRLLPFAIKFYMFTDGLYIIDAYDPSLIGSRVERFNNTPTETVYQAITKAFPGDNAMEAMWQSARHFAQPYTLAELGVIDDAKHVELSIVDSSGHRRKITPERRPFTSFTPALKAAPNCPTPLYLRDLHSNYWMSYQKNLRALYVQLNEVQDADNESLAEFSSRVGKRAAKADVRDLILDLRHSPGGNGYLTRPLLRQLIHFATDPGKGSLYVLIGRNTFSASQNLITDLDWIVSPIFVGEPSGSKPNAFSESGHITLPYSGLSSMLSSQFHQQSWPEDSRIWISPDVPVGLSSTDYFAGRDPAMEAITQLIKREH